METDYLKRAKQSIAYFRSVGSLMDTGLDTVVHEVNPAEKSVTLKLFVTKETLNAANTMHGGVIAWLADRAMATCLSVYSGGLYGVTADMTVDYIHPLPLGAEIIIKAFAVNVGGYIRRARTEFYCKGSLAATSVANFSGIKMPAAYRIMFADNNTVYVEDDMVRYFILEGSERTLVLDSGVSGARDVKKLAEAFTGHPAFLVNTHSDGDHIAGNKYFDECIMHPAEKELYLAKGSCINVSTVEDGTIIDPGDRPFEVIHIPGHTKGSIALLDINNRILYSGDSVQNDKIYMFGNHRSLDDLISSLEKLNAMKDRYDTVRACHGTLELDSSQTEKVLEAAKSVKAGTAAGLPKNLHGSDITEYDLGCAGFYCDR